MIIVITLVGSGSLTQLGALPTRLGLSLRTEEALSENEKKESTLFIIKTIHSI